MMHQCDRCGGIAETEEGGWPVGWGTVSYTGATGFRFTEKLCDRCMDRHIEEDGSKEGREDTDAQ